MNDVQFRSPQWCPRRRPRPWPRAGRLGAVVFVVFAVVLGPVAAVAAAEPPAGEVLPGGASPAADTGAADVGEAALAAAGTGLVFTGPTRLSDSAAGVGTVGRRVEAEEIVRLAVVEADVWGRPTGVPAVAMAVVLEVTATEPAGPGFVRAWSCRGAAPATSVLNVAPGSPRAMASVVRFDGPGNFIRARA